MKKAWLADVTFSPSAEGVWAYLELTKNQVSGSVELAPGIIVEVDKKGRAVSFSAFLPVFTDTPERVKALESLL